MNLFISCTARSTVTVYVLIVTARCRPVTVDDGRHAVLSGRRRNGRLWRRPVRPADITDGTVDNTEGGWSAFGGLECFSG